MCGQHRPARVTRGKTGGLQMENLSEPQTAEESRAHHNDSAECESNKKKTTVFILRWHEEPVSIDTTV